MSISSKGHHKEYLERIAAKYILLSNEELNSEIRKMRDEINRRKKQKFITHTIPANETT